MEDNNVALKDRILHALWLKEYEPSGAVENDKLETLLNSYLKAGLDKIKDYNEIPDFADKEMVKRSIYNEIKSDLVVSLKACALLFRKKEINRILELMEIDKKDKIYNAMEMLELVLPKKTSKDLNLLFDFILDPQYSNKAGVTQEVNLFYHKVIFNAPLLYNPWTKAVCVYCSWKNNETTILQKLKDNIQPDEHYLVKETKEYVLGDFK
jgi:ATP:ADP antiporter, AAA family